MYLRQSNKWNEWLLKEGVEDIGLPPAVAHFLRQQDEAFGPVENKHLTWIGQNPMLLQGTIRDNIRMGRPDASESAIEAAARSAGVLDFVLKLPKGLETEVGEQGQGLSRGEAQRIALARAFLKDAPLLLLDEPAAGLDAENEHRVRSAITALSRGRTVLLLTHRLAGLENANRILVMAEGRIVQMGAWSELSRIDGEFRRLLTKQHKGRERG